MEYFGDDTGMAYEMMNCCGGSWMSYRVTEHMLLTAYMKYMACRKCSSLDTILHLGQWCTEHRERS
jgi:hypothetical protein